MYTNTNFHPPIGGKLDFCPPNRRPCLFSMITIIQGIFFVNNIKNVIKIKIPQVTRSFFLVFIHILVIGGYREHAYVHRLTELYHCHCRLEIFSRKSSFTHLTDKVFFLFPTKKIRFLPPTFNTVLFSLLGLDDHFSLWRHVSSKVCYGKADRVDDLVGLNRCF